MSMSYQSGGNQWLAQQEDEQAVKCGQEHDNKLLFGLTARSRRTVAHLSLLFATDSFGSSMITGTLLAYYFKVWTLRRSHFSDNISFDLWEGSLKYR